MKCTWFKCEDEAVNEVKNKKSGQLLGYNCAKHSPTQLHQDYTTTHLEPLQEKPLQLDEFSPSAGYGGWGHDE
jgi:hypothetical protein